jgi:hypothetical protein
MPGNGQVKPVGVGQNHLQALTSRRMFVGKYPGKVLTKWVFVLLCWGTMVKSGEKW